MSTPAGGFPEPGERIGPYEIVRRLGAGGMGLVYEAVDTVLDRRVALKVVSPHLGGDPAFRVRFTHEAQAQASLDSPHVVQVFAHGEAGGSLYIASQLIPDGDLGGLLRVDGAPPPRLAVDLIAQVATGLADAHRTGLVHRDIKPANVLLRIRDDDVAAYLADFGIARRTDVHPGLTTRGAVGTPSYMAPELHTGGSPGPLSDVYSLGCLLWAALTGSAPYGGTTDFQVVEAHVSAPVPQLVATGPFEREVNRILRTAMAKLPADRYPSAAALRDDLRRVQRELPAPPHVRPGTDHQPEPAQKPRRSGLLVAGLVAAVLVMAFALARADDRGPAPTDDPGLGADERVAAANLSAALSAGGDLTTEEADCAARELVRESGVAGLQEQGVLDEELEYAADRGEVDPGVVAEIFTVSFRCVFDTAPVGGGPG